MVWVLVEPLEQPDWVGVQTAEVLQDSIHSVGVESRSSRLL